MRANRDSASGPEFCRALDRSPQFRLEAGQRQDDVARDWLGASRIIGDLAAADGEGRRRRVETQSQSLEARAEFLGRHGLRPPERRDRVRRNVDARAGPGDGDAARDDFRSREGVRILAQRPIDSIAQNLRREIDLAFAPVLPHDRDPIEAERPDRAQQGQRAAVNRAR